MTVVTITPLEAKKRLKRRSWQKKVRTLFEPASSPGTCWPETILTGRAHQLLETAQPFEGRLVAQNARYGVYIEMHMVRHGPGKLFFETCPRRCLTAEQLKDSVKKGRAIHLFSRRTVRTPMSKVRVKYTQDNRKMVGTPHYFRLRQRSYRQRVLKDRIARFTSAFEVQAAKDELERMRQEARVGRSRAAKAKWAKYREASRQPQSLTQSQSE